VELDPEIFVLGEEYIGLTENFQNLSNKRFDELREKYNIKSRCRLEDRVVDLILQYVQQSIAYETSIRDIRNELTEMGKASRKLNQKLNGISKQAAFHLRANGCPMEVAKILKQNVSLLQKASESSLEYINPSKKRGRKKEFPVAMLAAELVVLFKDASKEKPTIYKESDGKIGHSGNIINFALDIASIFNLPEVRALKKNLFDANESLKSVNK